MTYTQQARISVVFIILLESFCCSSILVFSFFLGCVCVSVSRSIGDAVYTQAHSRLTLVFYIFWMSLFCVPLVFFSFLSDVPPPPFYSYSLPFLLFPSFFLSTPAHPARECISPREKAATTPCFWCTSLWSNSDDTAGWLHRSQEGSQTRPRPNLPCSLL